MAFLFKISDMTNKLITERLILKEIQKEDVDIIYALRSNADVNAFIQRELYKTKEDALLYINKTLALISDRKAIVWVLKTIDSKESIGTICLWNFSEDKTIAEVGYDLLPEFQGKGYMSEALIEIVIFGFNVLSLNTIEAFTHSKNVGSIRLLEKANFKLLNGKIDKGFSNNIVYALKG